MVTRTLSQRREKHAELLSASPPRPAAAVRVAGIGASAGPDAFLDRICAIPPGSGLAFVLIQHLAPPHSSLLTELLAGDDIENLLGAVGIPIRPPGTPGRNDPPIVIPIQAKESS